MNQLTDTAPSLSDVADAYRQWRAQRTHRHATPLALRQQAVALLERHTRAEITTTLAINGTAFKQWMLALRADETLPVSSKPRAKQPRTTVAADFVELPRLTPTPAPVSTGADLIIDLPDGTRLSARGLPCAEQLLTTLAHWRGVA